MSAEAEPVELYQFVNKTTRPFHLTLHDILELKKEETLDVVIWDRNFEENWIWDHATLNEPYDPRVFFAENRCTLTFHGTEPSLQQCGCGEFHKMYMSWGITFPFGKTYVHTLHVDTTKLDTNWHWVPLDAQDGMLHIDSYVVKTGEKNPEGWDRIDMRWQDLPKSTRVGWRGPIMRWRDLKGLPKVYWKKFD